MNKFPLWLQQNNVFLDWESVMYIFWTWLAKAGLCISCFLVVKWFQICFMCIIQKRTNSGKTASFMFFIITFCFIAAAYFFLYSRRLPYLKINCSCAPADRFFVNLWVARSGTICTILKMWKTRTKECYRLSLLKAKPVSHGCCLKHLI